MDERIIFYDVFTDKVGKGNIIGIVDFPEESVSPEEYQQLAFKYRISEIAVILPSISETEYDYEFRFFSPKEEVSLCGHGTIGLIAFLDQTNKWSAKELKIKTQAGIIRCGVKSDGCYYMYQNPPIFYQERIDEQAVADILGIRPDLFKNYSINLPIQMVSTGRNKLMIPIKDLNSLLSIQPDFERMESFCRKIGTNGFHLFTFETFSERAAAHTRHFAPTAGVLEDPVTGIANGALGSYLVHYGLVDGGLRSCIYIEQGYNLGKAGEVYVEIVKDMDGKITEVMVGGEAVENVTYL